MFDRVRSCLIVRREGGKEDSGRASERMNGRADMAHDQLRSHWVGETGSLDDNVVELVSSLQQCLQRADEVVLHGAANAAVFELE